MEIKWYKCPICGAKFNYYKEIMGEETEERIAEICVFKLDNYMKHKKIKDKIIYNSISDEKKQIFLDSMHNGKSVGESYKKAGMTQEEGFVVMDFNLLKHLYLSDSPVKIKEKENEL